MFSGVFTILSSRDSFPKLDRKIAGILGNREKDDFLLEVGAGNGALLDHISSKNYIGLDFSEESLQVLKSKYKNAIVICVDDNFIPFGRSSFKNIVSIHTLEHIYTRWENTYRR